jgi:hypothetical protein
MALREKSSIAATTLKREAGRFLIMRKRIPYPDSFVEVPLRSLRPSAFSALKPSLTQRTQTAAEIRRVLSYAP